MILVDDRYAVSLLEMQLEWLAEAERALAEAKGAPEEAEPAPAEAHALEEAERAL